MSADLTERSQMGGKRPLKRAIGNGSYIPKAEIRKVRENLF
jgi:hypothetical protein